MDSNKIAVLDPIDTVQTQSAIQSILDKGGSFEDIDRMMHPSLYRDREKYSISSEDEQRCNYREVDNRYKPSGGWIGKGVITTAYVNDKKMGTFERVYTSFMQDHYQLSDGTIFREFGWNLVKPYYIRKYIEQEIIEKERAQLVVEERTKSGLFKNFIKRVRGDK